MSSGVGIGSLMINAQQLLDMPTILCGMVLVGITGAALDKAGRLLAPPAGVNRSSYDLFNPGLFSPRA
jgi:ABC-type nitrate/sulfonate/bicarbonate transport system permease component